MNRPEAARRVLPPEPGDTDFEDLARAELLRVIFRRLPIILLANVTAAATLVVGLWGLVPAHLLSVWLSSVALLNLARWLTARRWLAANPESQDILRHENAFLISTAGSGILWGSAAALFYLPGQPEASLFLGLILIAMAAASTTLLSLHRLGYAVFVAPVVVPLAAQFLSEPGITHLSLAAVMPIYFLLLFVLSQQIYRFSQASIVNRLLRERHALVDHLTAIANRRGFEEFLHREWRRGLRSQRPLTLIIADIDDFKRYNDTFGHPVGDAVLRAMANIFKQSARRQTDLAARIGGEEFAIIAAETDRAGAYGIARNLQVTRAKIARSTFSTWKLPTLSIGICTVTPSESGSVFKLFEEADAALYRSKSEGKNRITSCTIPDDDSESLLKKAAGE